MTSITRFQSRGIAAPAALLLGLALPLLGGCSDADHGTADTSTPSAPAATSALVEACSAENVDELRPDLVGRDAATVTDREERAGHTVRIIGEDDRCLDSHDDFNSERVNVITENGTVTWAAMY